MEKEYKFPEVLNKLIKSNNMKKYQFTEAVYIGHRTLFDWLSGKTMPSLSSLMAVADLFNVSIDYLVYGEDPEVKK